MTCSSAAQCLWDSPNPHNNHDYYLHMRKKSEINWFNLSLSARFPSLHTHTHIFFASQQRFSDSCYFLKLVLMWEHIKRFARPWLAHPLRNYANLSFHYFIYTSSLFRTDPKQLWPATHIWKWYYSDTAESITELHLRCLVSSSCWIHRQTEGTRKHHLALTF